MLLRKAKQCVLYPPPVPRITKYAIPPDEVHLDR